MFPRTETPPPLPRFARICAGISWVFIVVSPLVMYFAVTRARLTDAALLLLGFAVLRTLPVLAAAKREQLWAALRLPLVAVASAGASVVTGDPRALLVLPSLSQAAFAGVFFASLRGTPLVEHFARMQKPDLAPAQIRYCRTVTWVWGFVLSGAAVVGLALAAWASIAVWTAFTAVGCYVLVAVTFAIEYVVRKIRFREYGSTGVASLFDRVLAKLFPPPEPAPTPTPSRATRALTFGPVVEGRASVVVPADYVFFRGHFDGAPMLPGVAQITELVVPRARDSHPALGALRRLRRVRFRRPIFPGETVTVTIGEPDAGAGAQRDVTFELHVGEALVASGSLTFDPA